jgi:hypothetical protein
MYPPTRLATQRVPQRFALRRGQRPHRLTYGLKQEEELRRGLQADANLLVHYSLTEDAIYKMDAIVRFRDAPMWPAVGIQFTTKFDPEKIQRTIAAVRRSRIVSRLLYLQVDGPLTESAFPIIRRLVRLTATFTDDKGFISVVLASDTQGQYGIRDAQAFPVETPDKIRSQMKEEKAA